MELTKREQIEAILSGRASELLEQRFGQGWFERIDGREQFDVTEGEVVQYVQEHGFPEDGPVSDNKASLRDQIVLYDARRHWEVYYAERGARHDCATFPTREGAVREVVSRLMSWAETVTNSKIWKRGDRERA